MTEQERVKLERLRDRRHAVMGKAICRFLETYGWKIGVVSGGEIQKRGKLKYNFTFAIDFMGRKKSGTKNNAENNKETIV